MVKGVSKTIIEVNNTGSKYFEKIVFYVTPEYGTLNAKHLKRAAAEFAFNYNDTSHKSLRKTHRKKKILRNCIIGFGIITVIVGIILIF